MSDLKIAPSILSADFGRLNEEIASIADFSDWCHIDVMDGHFVPNLTFGAPVVKCIDTPLVKDCHLMIENPESFIEEYAKAGADMITIHAEAVNDLPAIIAQIKALGCKAGVSIKPGTEVSAIESVLPELDVVLIMSVEPGFGGQGFMENCIPKIEQIRAGYPELDICVDGGINAETAKRVVAAGANALVAGSFIFGADDRIEAIKELRSAKS